MKEVFRRRSSKKKQRAGLPGSSDGGEPPVPRVVGQRRQVYVNFPLPREQVDPRGEPLVQYQRNKVRTSSE